MQHKYLFPVSYFTFVQDGLCPVYVASQEGHTEVVDLLVQAGADIHLATTEEVQLNLRKWTLPKEDTAPRADSCAAPF